MNLDTKKFPRTQHIEGSRLQHGDGDMKVIPWSDLKRRPLVVSEKLDGANVGISFSDQGDLLLQSRGHYLRGGPREKQFDIFKQLANDNVDVLFDALCSRYILYGEWMYACHSIYYDDLPCYFHAFDVYDKERDAFLSTARRDGLLYDVYKTFITFAPVLAYQRTFNDINDLLALLGNCGYFTNERTSNYLITAHDSGFLRKDGVKTMRFKKRCRAVIGAH